MFDFDGRKYVLVVDYNSNYPEVEHLRDTRSARVINKIKGIFARHGKCQKLVSDNGPHYSSSEFSKSSDEWDFHHVTSSHTYHQSNGLLSRRLRSSIPCTINHLRPVVIEAIVIGNVLERKQKTQQTNSIWKAPQRRTSASKTTMRTCYST